MRLTTIFRTMWPSQISSEGLHQAGQDCKTGKLASRAIGKNEEWPHDSHSSPWAQKANPYLRYSCSVCIQKGSGRPIGGGKMSNQHENGCPICRGGPESGSPAPLPLFRQPIVQPLPGPRGRRVRPLGRSGDQVGDRLPVPVRQFPLAPLHDGRHR